MYLCSFIREGLGFWVTEKRIGFLPFWVYSEVEERERERERESKYKGFSFLGLFFIFLIDGVVIRVS